MKKGWKYSCRHLIVLQTGMSACRGVGAAGRVCCWLTWVEYNILWSSYNWAKKAFSCLSWKSLCHSFLNLFCFANSYSLDHCQKLNMSWLTIGLYLCSNYIKCTSCWNSNWMAAGPRPSGWALEHMLELPQGKLGWRHGSKSSGKLYEAPSWMFLINHRLLASLQI